MSFPVTWGSAAVPGAARRAGEAAVMTMIMAQ
jgi:hypothetical protein